MSGWISFWLSPLKSGTENLELVMYFWQHAVCALWSAACSSNTPANGHAWSTVHTCQMQTKLDDLLTVINLGVIVFKENCAPRYKLFTHLVKMTSF